MVIETTTVQLRWLCIFTLTWQSALQGLTKMFRNDYQYRLRYPGPCGPGRLVPLSSAGVYQGIMQERDLANKLPIQPDDWCTMAQTYTTSPFTYCGTIAHPIDMRLSYTDDPVHPFDPPMRYRGCNIMTGAKRYHDLKTGRTRTEEKTDERRKAPRIRTRRDCRP